MGRWQPEPGKRLMRAAFDLFEERGYDSTTVAEIAERAGLTKRTFFRHYSDKREVLFAGVGYLQDAMVAAAATSPAPVEPLAAIRASLEAAGEFFDQGPDLARRRRRIIAANPELQERELIKLAALAAALADELRGRGMREPTARLTAEAAVTVLRVALERWTADGGEDDLRRLIHESLDELSAITVPSPVPSATHA